MEIKGIIIEGFKEARKLGFPTANLQVQHGLEPGIYSGYANIGEDKHRAAMYVGARRKDILEVHLIGFEERDIYGEPLSVYIIDRIRDDVNITDEERLRELIQNDIEMVKLSLI